MSKFLISSEVAELLPRMQVVVVSVKGLDNSGGKPNVAAHVQHVVDKTVEHFASRKYANAQSHPRIALYRNTLKDVANVSTKKYPQSNESLVKRVLKEKAAPRPISPAVDFYNAVSIEHAVTAGAFDLDELKAKPEPLELRVSKVEQDTFVPLDAPRAEPGKVDVKEILYAQGSTVLTRHMAWRQSAQALVTRESNNIMFMSEVFNEGAVGGEPSELAVSVATSLQKGLKELLGVDSTVEFLGLSLGKLEIEL
ncbi:Uu.00g050060.m01.CDS01 [Anthostomella pinea]|uniref:Uu.00g050060.m01.CDS01 n=1 Tax=Anthostomella pinea TaxID=933095 RepID=A0AAI8VTD5_9PEZI|nr:Uu.00g050060.m01.CDS01 [Anthostomella pinea]